METRAVCQVLLTALCFSIGFTPRSLSLCITVSVVTQPLQFSEMRSHGFCHLK